MDFNGIYLHHANWNPNSVQNLLCRCSKHSRWIISVESHWKEMSTMPVLPWINQRMYLKDKFTKTLTGLVWKHSVLFPCNTSKGISPKFRFVFFFPFLALLFFSYKESFPLLLPELTFLFFLYSSVSPLFPSLLTLDDSYKTICRVHTFKVQVPFNISPSCNLSSGFCFVLLWAIRSVTQNNSTKCFCL